MNFYISKFKICLFEIFYSERSKLVSIAFIVSIKVMNSEKFGQNDFLKKRFRIFQSLLKVKTVLIQLFELWHML